MVAFVGKSRRDRMIDLGRRIAELREELQKHESEFDGLLAEGDSSSAAPGPNSLGDRLLKVCKDAPSRAFRADELMDEARIPIEKLATVRTTLARLVAAGLLQRGEEKGTYRLAESDESAKGVGETMQ
jgi:hypothetical protein